ncbi:MAG: dTMP kinase [Chloroflexi bacterium]|nr:dTMP kinase [Chloroflexota bacterium]
MLIALEGGEGSGKSTQAKVLYGRLCQAGYSVHPRPLREPGGTALGEKLRTLVSLPREVLAAVWGQSLVTPQPGSQLAAKELWLPISAAAELFLFAASRAQLVSEVIRPALARGSIVVIDRFVHSTLAYQGYGRGLDLELLDHVNRLATQGVAPDLVILLDVDPVKGIARKRRAQDMSRFEAEDIEFHRKVRQGYLELSQRDPQRWLVLDAGLPRAEVTRLVWEWVAPRLPARPASAAPASIPEKPKRLL